MSKRLISGGIDPSVWLLSASKLEQQVADMIADHINDQANMHALMKTPDLHAPREIKKKTDVVTCELRFRGLPQYKKMIEGLHMLPGIMRAKLDPMFFADLLGIKLKNLSKEITTFGDQWQIRRRGVENRLLTGNPVPQPDQTLIRMLTRAHQWVQDMRAGISLKQISYRESETAAYIQTRSRLAFLSPQKQQAKRSLSLNV